MQSQAPSQPPQSHGNVSVGRYLSTTHPDLIRQLEAFRKVYLDARKEPGEDRKVDNAIRAYVDPQFPRDRLSTAEVGLFSAISGIEDLKKYSTNEVVQQVPTPVNPPPGTAVQETAAAIAADAAAKNPPINPATQNAMPQPKYDPQRFTSNTSTVAHDAPSSTAIAHPVLSLSSSHRPSVEPLTPVPGSPAVPNGALPKRSFTEVPVANADASGGAERPEKPHNDEAAGEETSKEMETSAGDGAEEKPNNVDDAPAANE
jgi:hypothetical protein